MPEDAVFKDYEPIIVQEILITTDNVESGILVEKHHGYKYEHFFSYDWNVMKGYHGLMRLGHVFNILA